jgi:hypothetical protein
MLLRSLLLTAGLCAYAQLPLPSPGNFPVQLPQIPQNHITSLSATIAGRPMPQRPGARPIYVGGGWIGGAGYYQQPQSQPMVFVNSPTINQAPPAPILVMNSGYQLESPKPVLREYSNISNPYENFQPNKPKVFLLALKDGTLRQSVAFWVEESKLHFVQPDHKQDSLDLSKLDREATKQFNSERGIDIKLPE